MLNLSGAISADWLATTLAGFALQKVLVAIVVAVVCLIVIKVLVKLVQKLLDRTPWDKTIKRLLMAVVKIALLFIGVIIVMGCLGIPVTSLVAVLSVLGLAVSLAVQNFLSNVAGGVQIMASKPFREGDFVEASGCSGTVEEVGLFYTKLKTLDNKLIQMPNSSIVAANITNYSSETNRRVEFKVSASYNDDTEKVKSILMEHVRSHPLTLDDPEPAVHINAYQANDIEYVVRCWCANGDYWTVYFDLLDGVKPAFDRAGIAMSYPHVNVHMIEK